MEVEQKPTLIGFSLSLCVQDIVHGKINEADVVKIIANTCAPNVPTQARLIKGYCERYWDMDPERGKEVAERLFAEGKVEQPRVDGKQHPGLSRTWRTEDEWNECQKPRSMRNIYNIIDQVIDTVPSDFKGTIKEELMKLKQDSAYCAPELMWEQWGKLSWIVGKCLPWPPQNDWQWKVAEIVTTKSKEELKK